MSTQERLVVALAEDDPTFEAALADLSEHLSATEVAALRTIAAKLRGARRREELLKVLHDTATDLTAIRDVEAVLQAIVARTRTLMGSDMAYLSLNDYATQETYIRKSDGVFTPEYRRIRMPLGTGVLGKVATGLSPVAVTDYLSEVDIVHLPDIDRIVRGEGVRTIMGVPLTVHGRVLGALLVAERSRRRFTAEEIDLVDSVGKHAAVAIDNAQRFAEVTEALSRLGAARTADEATLASVQALLELDEMLIEVVVAGRSFTDLLAAAHRALPYPAAFIHPAGHLLGSVGVEPARADRAIPGLDWLQASSAPVRARIGVVSRAARATGRAQLATVCGRVMTVAAALAGDQFLGTVVIGTELGPPERLWLERVAVFAAVMRLFGRAAQGAEFQRQGELVEAIVAGRAGGADVVAERLSRFGFAGPQVSVLAVQPGTTRVAEGVRRGLRGQPLLMTTHDEHVCVLVAGAGAVAAKAVLSACATEGVRVRVSHTQAAQVAAIAAAHQLAQMGLAVSQRLHQWGITDATALGAVGAVVQAAGADLAVGAVQPLLDYDRVHASALAATALTYLDCDAGAGAAAAALFVHRNTVRQRLARIGAILGPDWASGPRRLDSHLALRVWSLQGHGDGN